jgi:anhydro-N-acetylmuramic acid kinase
MYIIGLMSGTSADGIEVAIIEVEPKNSSTNHLDWRLVSHISVPFSTKLHADILHGVTPKATVEQICSLNFELGEAFANAALTGIQHAGLSNDQIAAIGSHGQTVWHIPAYATLQIGSGAVIAERTGITTISNFRARDIAAGGQGAPLVAFTDVLMLTHPTLIRAAQNIGGIGNVTYLPPANTRDKGEAFAFDTGPGNMLIDDVARRATNSLWHYDIDGQLAAEGKVDGVLYEELMDHPFMAQRPPKTTGREVFGANFGEALWQNATSRNIKPADLAATVTMLTAASISYAYTQFLPHLPDEVIVSGGGAKNPTLMRMLHQQLSTQKPTIKIILSDDLGIKSDAKEAIAFAVLAYQTLCNRPSNLPSATGARHAVILGDITPSASGFTPFLQL